MIIFSCSSLSSFLFLIFFGVGKKYGKGRNNKFKRGRRRRRKFDGKPFLSSNSPFSGNIERAEHALEDAVWPRGMVNHMRPHLAAFLAGERTLTALEHSRALIVLHVFRIPWRTRTADKQGNSKHTDLIIS